MKKQRKKLKNDIGFFRRHIINKPIRDSFWMKHGWLKYTVKVLAWLAVIVYPFLCFSAAEYINFGTSERFLNLYNNHIKVFVLDITVFYIIFGISILLFRRLWISCAAVGAMSVALSTSSFLKFQNTGEYLYPWDLQQVGNVNTLSSYINSALPKFYVMVVVALAIITVFVWLSRISLRIKWNIRIPVAIILVALIFIKYNNPTAANTLALNNGMSFGDGALQESNYRANGFVGAFTLNILSSVVSEPGGYSEEEINRILNEYKAEDGESDFNSPNVILILQESYWDVTNLTNCEFSYDPLANYREIAAREGAYSGKFVTPGFGGGTVRPEFESLTGVSTNLDPPGSVPYQYINSDIESYPSLFSSLGYHTVAMHPYNPQFYMRQTKYPYLGFDDTYFIDELSAINEVNITYKGKQVSDDTFVDYICNFINTTDEPLFLFGISMEGHQPYNDKYTAEGRDITVTCDGMDATTLDAVTNYTQAAADADKALKKLIDYVDSCEEDTVVVFYGDHAPTIGANKAGYVQGGLIADPNNITKEDSSVLFTTPFLIYANFDLGTTEMLPTYSDNQIHCSNIMNAVCDMLGTPTTKYMQFMRDFASLYYDEGYFGDISTNPDYNKLMYYRKLLTYDILFGKGYSQK